MKNEEKSESKDDKENNNESNNNSKKDDKTFKKKIIPLTDKDKNESNSKEEKNKEDNENLKESKREKKGSSRKYKTEVRVRKRLEIVNDQRGIKDLDKSKKKDIKKEDSLSNFSVEYSEVIKENGELKKDDEEIKKKKK